MSLKRAEVLPILLVVMSTACSGEADLPTASLTASAAVETTTSQSHLTEPTSTTHTATAETAAAIELASDFLYAYWAFDIDQALGYLADEALDGAGPR